MKFLLDANFLLIPGKFKVDVFRELEKFGKPELYTLDLVVKELEGLEGPHSRLALGLITKKKVKILEAQGNTDNEIVRTALKGFVVCTQDRALIKRLKDKGLGAVTLRQGKYLVKT